MSLGDGKDPFGPDPKAESTVSIGSPPIQAVASGTVSDSLQRIYELAECLLRAGENILWRVRGHHGRPDVEVEDSPVPIPPAPGSNRFLAATDDIQAVLSRTTANLAEAISTFDENFGV